MTEFQEHFERTSDVKGYTVVVRKGRRPKIHLFRPWPECNTTERKSGKDTVRFEGGKEQLLVRLTKLGYHRGGIECKRCFPYAPDKDVEKLTLEIGDAEITETLDKYDEEIRTGETVLAEL